MDKNIKNKLPEIKRVFQKYGTEQAYLFGSAAVGTMEKNSDVDFLFQFPKNIDFVLYADNYFALIDDLKELLQREVDLLAIETLSNKYLIEKIDSQKIQIV